MAQLNSPGVSVTVIDESFYNSAAPGTVPLIVVASSESKQNGAGTGVATGTDKANAGKLYLLTSQKDVADVFGTPTFEIDTNNNPVHASELNEYGLQTAYSYLGVSNRAYVLRADVNLAQLVSRSMPKGAPSNGTFWLNTANTKYGIFEWNDAVATSPNGQTFINKVPLVITDKGKVKNFVPSTGANDGPLDSIGAIGDYAVISVSTLNKLWYKKPATGSVAAGWVAVGSDAWRSSRPSATGTAVSPTLADGASFEITLIENENDADPVSPTASFTASTFNNSLTWLASQINSHVSLAGKVTAAVVSGHLELYSTGITFKLTGTAVATTGLVASKRYTAIALQISAHTSVPKFKRVDFTSNYANGRPTGSIWIKSTSPNLGASWILNKYNSSTKQWVSVPAPLYANNASALKGLDPTGGGFNLALNTSYVKYNDDEGTPQEANFVLYTRRGAGATTIKSIPITASTFTSGSASTFTISETTIGSTTFSDPVSVSFTYTQDNGASAAVNAASAANAFLTALTNLLVGSNVIASLTTANEIVISHTQGGEIKIVDGTNTPIYKGFTGVTNFYVDPTGTPNNYVASLWTSQTATGMAFAEASPSAPSVDPEDGTLWYNGDVKEADIMIHDGTTWKAYRNVDQSQVGGDRTDPAGPLISASKPLTQSDGTALAHGDLWIDTTDLENYPKISRFNFLTKKWVLIDNTDQTTENGILFDDARWNTNGLTSTVSTIVDLLGGTGDQAVDSAANFLDPDAPDPALYPAGMLLFNTRRSSSNVKKFVKDYVDIYATNTRFQNETMANYYPNRWVTVSENQETGAGSFGRKAQRMVVVRALQAVINSNQRIRDEESVNFNLIACPGYPELMGEMKALNYDRGLTAFVVGDAPARLAADATSLGNWGTNVNNVAEDGDNGLVTFDEYLGVFYPWGYTSDNYGNNIVVPPSHMILRTMSLSDNVSYPWFAPAGTRRGGITNATTVGYVDSQGEFVAVSLNTGQRDTLQQVCKVNPITFIAGTGLVNYGQLTRAKNASSLDRINVARLVIYLRGQFSKLAKPYVFEPNDKITRDELKGAAENLLLELVGQRALYDYVVVCDTSNNTPARIDKNELYLDVAIEPVKAVEFIYIPLRLKNTGEIKGLAK